MGLDRETRKCQNVEAYDECRTRLHEECLRQKCGCLPLSLRLSEKVKYNDRGSLTQTRSISLHCLLKYNKIFTGYFVHDKPRNHV